MSSSQPADILTLTIKDRSGQVYDGEVLSVSSVSDLGPFDILARHSNMVTTIKEKIMLQKKRDSFDTIKINSGLLRVTNNKVEIYIGL